MCYIVSVRRLFRTLFVVHFSLEDVKMFEDFGDVAGVFVGVLDVDREWEDEDHYVGDDDFFDGFNDDFKQADSELYDLEEACFAHFVQEYQGEIGKSDMVIDSQYR